MKDPQDPPAPDAEVTADEPGAPGVDNGPLSPADDPAVDTTGGVPTSVDEMGGTIYMKHPDIDSEPVATTRMQFDDVWVHRGWVEAPAPVPEEGSVPGADEQLS